LCLDGQAAPRGAVGPGAARCARTLAEAGAARLPTLSLTLSLTLTVASRARSARAALHTPGGAPRAQVRLGHGGPRGRGGAGAAGVPAGPPGARARLPGRAGRRAGRAAAGGLGLPALLPRGAPPAARSGRPAASQRRRLRRPRRSCVRYQGPTGGTGAGGSLRLRERPMPLCCPSSPGLRRPMRLRGRGRTLLAPRCSPGKEWVLAQRGWVSARGGEGGRAGWRPPGDALARAGAGPGAGGL